MIKQVAITGSNGFLGRGITEVLSRHYQLRLADISHEPGLPGECMECDVSQLEDCRKIVQEMDALVITHMAPRIPDSYQDPELPMNINVKGTAHLFHAAVESGIKRICLISSAGVVKGYPEGTFHSRELPLLGKDLYSLTKVLQEKIADHYHSHHGIPVSYLRPSGIVDAEENISKYGSEIPPRVEHLIDRHDLGEVVHRTLQMPDLRREIFYGFGHSNADQHWDVAYTRERLDWTPRHGDKELEALYA